MNFFKLTILFFSLLFSSFNLFSQSNQACPFINAGADQTFDCLNPCVELSASYLEIKETTSYTVESIPHAVPIPYNQIGGTAVSANTDDVWGPIITLPFPFCYYGQTYTTCKIGSNGSILFGPTSGGGSHPWSFSTVLTEAQGITNAGHVLGVYHDIDPSVCGGIKWYLVGQAPCRQFIVSFNNICHFSCTSIKSRHMMVLNEGTNYIDVYVEAKPLCTTWNGGNSVIGLQKIDQISGGVAVPGRNSDVDWTVTSPEAWRFKPSGNPVQSVEWYDGTTLVGTGDTIQICPLETTTYTAKFSFTICGTANVSTVTDDVTLYTSPFGIDITSQNINCAGATNGSIVLNPLQGIPPFTFQLDTNPPQSTGQFLNLPAGTYTTITTDSQGCESTIIVNITEPDTVELSLVSTTSTTCNLINGEFTMLTTGGVSPYMYSVDTFLNVSTTGIFENTYPGYFFINVVDANGCADTLTIFVNAETAITAQLQSTQNVSCFGLNNGSFEVNAYGGPTPYTYSFNSGVGNSTTNYNSLIAGNYTVVVKDTNGCIYTLNHIITQPDLLEVSVPATNPACSGESFTYNALVSGGTIPYSYLWNNNFTTNPLTITPSSTTTYNLKITDSNGCEAQNSLTQTLLQLPVAMATITPKEGLEPLIVSVSNQSINSNTYFWDFGNGSTQTTSNSASVTASYPNAGIYYITLASSNGLCSDFWIDSVKIYPVLEIEVPNVFTPNEDGLNEGYSILTKNATGIEATIFNRWGNKIVEITDLNYKWNGKSLDGSDLLEGVYFIKYKVTSYNNQEISGQTFLHLIR